ncbi:MAG: hypothetical protein ACKOOA_04695, partial [Sediminibacterium sp.]
MPVKKSTGVKVAQRLDFVIEKGELQNFLRDDKGGSHFLINFGIDYDQKIWVSASSATSFPGERPSYFAQKLVFCISKKSVRDVLKLVKQGGYVKVSMVIDNDQKLLVSLSPN